MTARRAFFTYWQAIVEGAAEDLPAIRADLAEQAELGLLTPEEAAGLAAECDLRLRHAQEGTQEPPGTAIGTQDVSPHQQKP